MLQHLTLGEAGIDFILTCLKQGGELSQIAREIVSQSEGVCFAPVPANVSRERALRFDVGGLMSRRMQFKWIRDRTLSFCRRSKRSLFILEDQALRRGDEGLSNVLANVIYFRDEVYYFVECGVITEDRIEAALREVRSFRSISFLVGSSDASALKKFPSIDDEVVSQLAKNISEIFVSAYDQEGVVVWSRHPRDLRIVV